MKNYLTTGIFALAAGGIVFASPAFAGDSGRCGLATQHAQSGYEAYLPTFEKAVRFLNNNNIAYEKTGLGQSSSSKFSIDANFDQAKSDDVAPMVLIRPLSGSQDTKFGYVLVGSLSSYIYHSDCGATDMTVFGHTWTKSMRNNSNRTKKALTSLSAAGSIARGYHAGLASYQTGFEGTTYIIRIEDFGTGERYQGFMDIINTLPYGGTD